MRLGLCVQCWKNAILCICCRSTAPMCTEQTHTQVLHAYVLTATDHCGGFSGPKRGAFTNPQGLGHLCTGSNVVVSAALLVSVHRILGSWRGPWEPHMHFRWPTTTACIALGSSAYTWAKGFHHVPVTIQMRERHLLNAYLLWGLLCNEYFKKGLVTSSVKPIWGLLTLVETLATE